MSEGNLSLLKGNRHVEEVEKDHEHEKNAGVESDDIDVPGDTLLQPVHDTESAEKLGEIAHDILGTPYSNHLRIQIELSNMKMKVRYN